MSDFNMRGKTVLVTGAASGIGLATARRLGAAGASVVLADIADASAAAGETGGRYVAVDVTDESSVAEMMREAAGEEGLHGIVLSAGVTAEDPLDQISREQMQWQLDVNTFGPMFVFKHAAGHFADGGGAIVAVASLAASVGLSGYGSYAASKAATVALTRVAAVELGPRRIRVNAICPSSVETPMLRAQANGEVEAQLCSSASTLGSINTAEQVAALAHFLLADDCPTISGQAINIDAGMTAGYSVELIDRLLTSHELSAHLGAPS